MLSDHEQALEGYLHRACAPQAKLDLLRRRYLVEQQLLAADAQLQALSMAGPQLLAITSAVVSVGLLLGGTVPARARIDNAFGR